MLGTLRLMCDSCLDETTIFLAKSCASAYWTDTPNQVFSAGGTALTPAVPLTSSVDASSLLLGPGT